MQETQRNPATAIYESDSSATQSMHALMIAAQELNLLTNLMPVDMRDEETQIPAAIKLIWPDTDLADEHDMAAKKAKLPEQDKDPDQRGQYYLVALYTDTGERLPILIPEGHVVPQVFMLAAKAGKEEALRVLYRHGILPTA